MLEVARLLELGRRSSVSVGLGCSRKTSDAVRARLHDMRSSIKLTAYGDEHALLSGLKNGAIVAGVRGTLSSSEMVKGMRDAFSLDDVKRVALLEDSRGKPFLLAPVGIDEGRDYGSRLSLARATLDYFSGLNWNLRVGILSKGRVEDVDRGSEIRTSIEEGCRMADMLTKDGYDAKHYSILIEDAVGKCDFLVAPDGVSGNLIFRTLHFLGGCKAYGAPVVNLHEAVFIDTSRAKEDFTDPVLLAAGLHVALRKSK